jgi:hypothetical protein
MLQHDFQFFANIMTFFSPKKRSNSPFSYLLFTFMQIFKPKKKKKKLIMTCAFECFQSHCHILKELHEFLGMRGAISMFWKNSFILWVMDWWQSHLGFGAHSKEVVEKAKCQKTNVVQPN